MRNAGLIFFAMLALVIHVAVAAVFFTSPNDAAREERGAGTAALEVGNLFDSIASEAIQAEQVEAVQKPIRELTTATLRQAIHVKAFTQEEVVAKPLAAAVVTDATEPLIEELKPNHDLTDTEILQPKPLIAVPAKRWVKPTLKRLNSKLVQAKTLVAEPIVAKALAPTKPKPIEEAKLVEVKPRPKAQPRTKPKPKNKTVQKKKASKAAKASRKGGVKANKKAKKSALGGNGGKNAKAKGQALTSDYKGSVRSRVWRYARYPASEGRRGSKGTPRVAFTITATGALKNLRLVKSSGNARLDKAAISAVKRAAPFPKLPKATLKKSISFNLGITLKPK